ncbi:hypothetical protein I7I53_08924 [Histoplasma capsulatum var. duboisii H88]|uniref:Uncharacterized protein n=1 Tax=Ajellomyces capsulatus (strain H88) TaxID=544711 RepID=A0A8A1L9S0_AJEC8|nr:hypothetical protein I7I53_08924 [Histoplasma capsulatum var. duboisii H88]
MRPHHQAQLMNRRQVPLTQGKRRREHKHGSAHQPLFSYVRTRRTLNKISQPQYLRPPILAFTQHVVIHSKRRINGQSSHQPPSIDPQLVITAVSQLYREPVPI